MSVAKPTYAMAFIDGQNLYLHAKEAFGYHHPNYDPLKLHAHVCATRGWTPNLVRFYTGVPLATHDPMWAGYWNARVLALKRAGVNVTTRQLRYRTEYAFDAQGAEQKIVVPHEKGIDVRLALDIIGNALTGQFDVGVIYSQDQDLAEVVADVKRIAATLGKRIDLACAFPSGPNASSKRGIDKTEWVRITQDEYDACIDTRDYRPAQFR